jgi:hypothetical protein
MKFRESMLQRLDQTIEAAGVAGASLTFDAL